MLCSLHPAGFGAFVEHDPLAVRTVSLRFVAATADLDRRVPAAVAATRVPVLCLLAGGDGVVDNAGTRRLLGTSRSPDVTVREAPGARHNPGVRAGPGGMDGGGVTGWLGGLPTSTHRVA